MSNFKKFLSWYPEIGEVVLVTILDLDVNNGVGVVVGKHETFNDLHKILFNGKEIFAHYYELKPIWHTADRTW
jgi:hypothetical protein